MQQIAYFFHPDGRRESGNNFRTALLSVFSKMTRGLIFSDKLMLCDSVMIIHERHKLRRGWNEEFKITLLIQVTLLWSPAVWSTSETSLWDQRLTPPAPVNFLVSASRALDPQVGWEVCQFHPQDGAPPAGTVLTALSLLQDDQGAPLAPGLGDEVHRRGSPIFCGPQLAHHHL